MQVFTPLSQLYNDPNTDYLRLQCAHFCLCEDRQLDDDVSKKAGASTATGYFDVDRERGDPVEPDADGQASVNGINVPSQPAPLPIWVSQPPVHGNPPPATPPNPRFPLQAADTLATTTGPVNVVEAYYVDPYWDMGVACNGDFYGNPTLSDCFSAIQALEDVISEDAWFDPYRFSYSPNPRGDGEEEAWF